MNKKTKKIFTTLSKNGYYFFYNLPEGEYTFKQWQIVTVVTDQNVFLLNTIDNLNFTIEKNVFKTVKNIKVKVEIPKEFTYQNKYFTSFDDENLEEIQTEFNKKDPKGYWKDIVWVQQSLPKIEEQKVLTDADIAENYADTSDSDYYTMQQLYKKGNYYLSFMLFHRIIVGLLDAHYVKKVDRNIPDIEDLTDLAKKAHVDLNSDQLLLLNDLNVFNDRIKNGTDNDKFKSIFTKDYFEKYLKKVDEIRTELKKIME